MLWSHLQIIIEHDCLAVKHEVSKRRIVVENIKQPINCVYQTNAKLLKCLIPLAVPMCMRYKDYVELLGHNTSLLKKGEPGKSKPKTCLVLSENE